MATLIYPQSSVFFVLLWVTLIYTTAAQWRDFIISGIGFAIPIMYYMAHSFVFDSPLEIGDYGGALFNFRWTDLTLFMRLLFVVFISMSVFAFFTVVTTINTSIVRIKKMLVIVVLMFFIGLTTLFFNEGDYLATFLIVSIPLAIVFANFFQKIKKTWLAEVLFLCLIGCVVLGYFS